MEKNKPNSLIITQCPYQEDICETPKVFIKKMKNSHIY